MFGVCSIGIYEQTHNARRSCVCRVSLLVTVAMMRLIQYDERMHLIAFFRDIALLSQTRACAGVISVLHAWITNKETNNLGLP